MVCGAGLEAISVSVSENTRPLSASGRGGPNDLLWTKKGWECTAHPLLSGDCPHAGSCPVESGSWTAVLYAPFSY